MKYMQLLCVLLIAFSGRAEDPDPMIRVQFTVGEALPAEKPGEEPSFNFKIEIINTTQQPIDIVCWGKKGEDAKDSLISHIRGSISFTAKPTVLTHPVQTMMDSVERVERKEATYKLLPGKPLEVNLRYKPYVFGDRNLEGPLTIPIPGLFEITAHVRLLKGIDGSYITHSSNAQKIPIGGSHERPRNCSATILDYDAKTGAATFKQADPDFGNRVGDRFNIIQMGAGIFVFEVTELEKGKFKAKLVEKPVSGELRTNYPIGASLQSEFNRKR